MAESAEDGHVHFMAGIKSAFLNKLPFEAGGCVRGSGKHPCRA